MILTHTILFRFFGGASPVDDTVEDPGTPIVNADATVELSQYEICQRTGFRMLPQHDYLSKMRIEWTGLGVRSDSFEPRHPQDYVNSVAERAQTGPESPESDDVFITDDIDPDDL